jgi:intein-encoded DNA endonuclease-like protein
LDVSNGNLAVLSFAKHLLTRLNILVTGPNLAQRGGRFVVIKGRTCVANKNIYRLHVRARSLNDYSRQVGFAVKRKQDTLMSAVAGDRIHLVRGAK